jgi:hypothetical protein
MLASCNPGREELAGTVQSVRASETPWFPQVPDSHLRHKSSLDI